MIVVNTNLVFLGVHISTRTGVWGDICTQGFFFLFCGGLWRWGTNQFFLLSPYIPFHVGFTDMENFFSEEKVIFIITFIMLLLRQWRSVMLPAHARAVHEITARVFNFTTSNKGGKLVSGRPKENSVRSQGTEGLTGVTVTCRGRHSSLDWQ